PTPRVRPATASPPAARPRSRSTREGRSTASASPSAPHRSRSVPHVRARDAALVRDLGRLLDPERVLSRPIDLLGRSVDASIYRLIPRAVVRPRDVAEVQALLAYARSRGRHLTFRAGGTSLSGQAVTDDILVELAPFWKGVRVLDGGARVWCQPGV